MKKQMSTLLALLLLFCTFSVYAQMRTVSGNVTDQDGIGVIAATVRVTGTDIGTVTDVDGNFTLEVPSNAETLTVSYVGMDTKVVPVEDYVNVSLAQDSTQIEAVEIGYTAVDRNQLTGSAVQVSSEEIEQMPVSSVDQVMQGKVAGLTFAGNSGTPGSTGAIRIRGLSTLTAGAEPLFVVDGVPITNQNYGGAAGGGSGSSFSALSSIDVNDIESYTVLKDASAIAAYGASGTNGVIIITTKKGKDGKTKFNFSSTYGVSQDATEGPKMLTAPQREELFLDGVYNTFGGRFGFSREESQQWATANIGRYNEYVNWRNNGAKETLWADVITNDNAPSKTFNLSASGGDEISNFYASLGYQDQEATVVGSKYDRISGSIRYNRDLSKAFKFSTNNSVSHGKQDGLLEQSAYFSGPRTVKFFGSPILNPYQEDGSLTTSWASSLSNPLWIANNDINLNKLTRLSTNNSLTWATPVENLKFTTRYALDFRLSGYQTYQNRIMGDGVSTEGYASQSKNTTSNQVFQNSLDYFFNLGEVHNFDVKGLVEYQTNDANSLFADGENFAADGLFYLSSAGKPTSASSAFTDWKKAAYLGMLNYDLNDKYVVNATFRREANSRFDKNNRWGNFWSVGAGWNLHKEDFLGSNAVDLLKLRASYGLTGNSDIGLNRYQALLGFDADYIGSAAVYPSTFGADNLSWEKAKNFEVGLDFGFVDRVKGAVSYYKRDTYDMLFNVPIPTSTGFGTQVQNVGEMYNKGIEAELSVDAVRTDNFRFTLGGNIAKTKNQVTSLPEDEYLYRRNGLKVGHTAYEWYLKKYAGVDPQTGEELWFKNGIDGETTNDYNAAVKAFQGESRIPTLTAGLNADVEYKGFYASANGYYAGGHKVYEAWHRYTNGTDLFSTSLFNGVSTLMNRWQKPGDVTDVPKVIYGTNPWRDYTRFLYDGDYFRLKNVTVGYTFPTEFTNKVGLGKTKFFLRGTNLLTKVKDDRLKYDPEVNVSTGLTSLTTPPVKTFLGGINVNF